jgi:hypothetical protein
MNTPESASDGSDIERVDKIAPQQIAKEMVQFPVRRIVRA